jgi:hypothetical protein
MDTIEPDGLGRRQTKSKTSKSLIFRRCLFFASPSRHRLHQAQARVTGIDSRVVETTSEGAAQRSRMMSLKQGGKKHKVT